jgi:bifunctional non-homologous end joining protein LigD
MHRHPDGIAAQGFFHKDLQEHHPKIVQTERIVSSGSGKSINYLLCQNEFTLLYMANLGCIEINPWLSRIGSLDRPDAIVIDLDPDDANPFDQVIQIALEIHRILEKIGAPHFCKTSGSTGLHIFIPTQARYDYDSGRNFALEVCQIIKNRFPNITSLERSPSKRRGRIYLDCFQNAKGQTVAAAYSVRPRIGAPVSTPLHWKELKVGLRTEDFTIFTIPGRVEKLGDLWKPVLKEQMDLEACLSSLRKNFPIQRKGK